jgi:hypothetical protein
MGLEWRLPVLIHVKRLMAWVIEDSAALSEEDIGEEWMEDSCSASQRCLEYDLSNTRARSAYHHYFL